MRSEKKSDVPVKKETPPRTVEDVPRETPNLRNIEKSEYVRYSREKISEAQKKLGDIIGRIRYNSLDRTVTLLREHEANPNTPLLTKYQNYKIVQSPEMVENG